MARDPPADSGWRVEGIWHVADAGPVTAEPQIITGIVWGREAADERAGELWAAGWRRVKVVFACGGNRNAESK